MTCPRCESFYMKGFLEGASLGSAAEPGTRSRSIGLFHKEVDSTSSPTGTAARLGPMSRIEDTDSFLRQIAAAPARNPPRRIAFHQRNSTAGGELLADRYRLDRELGRGAMGQVFAARDLKLNRDVAIKLLLCPPANAKVLGRFEREARASAAVNHTNIVTVFDVVSSEPEPFIVSELLEGETLREKIAAGPLPPAAALGLGLQLAEGLAAAHEQHIVHRDIKPANLFVTHTGRLKILDFGVAKLLDTQDAGLQTDDGIALGTLGYMAPEQVRCEAVDARADIFSAGVVLYETLAGRRPFEGKSRYEIESRILTEEPAAAPYGAPRELVEIIRRCLQKDPGLRFQSAREIAESLRGVSHCCRRCA